MKYITKIIWFIIFVAAIFFSSIISPQKILALTSGPNNPTAATNNTGIGVSAWANPTNVYSNNAVYASVVLKSSGTSQYLFASGYGFTIPAGSTITGIVAEVNKYASNNTYIRDNSVKLFKNGAAVGTDKADTTGWGTSDPATYVTYGTGTTDLWGTTWTAEDINASNFGFGISAKDTRTTTAIYTANIDHIRITIYYNPPPITLTQNYYRWYVNNSNSVSVSDPWPEGATNLAENSEIGSANSPPNKNDILRLRMTVQDTYSILYANFAAFKLKYAVMSGGACGGGDESWLDVGSTGSTTNAWRGYDNVGISNDSTLPSTVLSVSDVKQNYVENNQSPINPQPINVNLDGEWDWVIQNYNAEYNTAYCFKMVNQDNTDLNGGYNYYPKLITAPRQSISLSGTVYTDEGQTNIGINKTIKVLLNGVNVGTTETNSSGRWDMNVGAGGGDIVSVYLFEETEKGSTIYIADGTPKTDINLYRDHLIIHSDAGPVSNSHLSAGSTEDVDLLYSVTSNNLTIASSIEAYVWPGTTFSPKGDITTQGSGDLHLSVGSTFSAENTYNHMIAGNLIVDSNSTLSGSGNLEINGGNVSGDGSINLTSGNFMVKSNGNFGSNTGWTFYNLNFGDGVQAGTTVKNGINTIVVNNQLSISTNHTLQAGSSTWSFIGDGIGLFNNIKSIVTGHTHTCALKSDNTVFCWGSNSNGQIGDNTSGTNCLAPVQVVGLGGTGTLSAITQISAGDTHTCALKSDNTVYCWGNNVGGQIGDNTSGTNRLAPVQVVGPSGTGTLFSITQISAGGYHTCALKSDNTVFCWGSNSNGQIGDNNSGTNQLSPVQVKGAGGTGTLSSITQISAGGYHSCALKSDNTLFCWGGNSDGQIGDNTFNTDRLAPVPVVGPSGTGTLSSVIQIDSGYNHTCALKSDNTVYCWGDNTTGQLGDNTFNTDRLAPVQVKGAGGTGTLSSITQITAGSSHTCALKSDNTLFCWGSNSNGQLGDNTYGTDRLAPVQVVGLGGTGTLSSIIQISAGGFHTCALKSDSTLFCWGDNTFGQIGFYSSSGIFRSPVHIGRRVDTSNLSSITQISVNSLNTCALKSDNTVYCWGYNGYGQVGNNTAGGSRLAPVQVVGLGDTGTLSAITQISVGDRHACALKSDHTVYCWGGNYYGQIGDNTSGGNRLTPLQVVGLGGTGTLSAITQISNGHNYTCALKSDNTVYCWGSNNYGQVGNNTSGGNVLAPIQVKGVGGTGTLSSIIQITAGTYHTCALKSDNTVYCWGYNGHGEIGINTSGGNVLAPTQVKGVGGSGTLSSIIQITAETYHTCALKSDNTVYCWGNNPYGQLGDNTSNTNRLAPVQVKGVGGSGTLSSITQISVGDYHSCALKSDHTVFCWGINTNGQLGDNTSGTDRLAPVQVVGLGGTGTLSSIIQITAGGSHTCALKSDNAVYCWGLNDNGQLSDFTATTRSSPNLALIRSGSPFVVQGNFSSQTSTFEYLGPNFSVPSSLYTTLISLAPTNFHNLTISNSLGDFILRGGTTITNNFNISSGSLNSYGSNHLVIGGNFTNSGNFIPDYGSITFNDSSKTSTLDYVADTTFYNLNILGVGKIVKFDSIYKTKVTNSLNFQGQDCSNKLFLKSISEGNQWDLNYTGIGSSAIVNYVDLHDSNAVNSLTANNSTEINDNNTNWTISQGSCEVGNQSPNAPQTPFVNNNTAQTGQSSPVSGLVDHTPAFSAIFDDPDTSDTASAYQIQVGTDTDWTNGAEMWDSGKITISPCNENSRCSDIAYVGSTLNDGSTYYWRLVFWDNNNAQGSWSSDQQFSLNSPPIVSNISVNGGLNVNLNEGTTLPVTWTGVITDADGSDNVSSSKGKLYRSGVSGAQNCTLNNNNCYENLNCTLSDCSGNTCNVSCLAYLQFHADPTDAISPNSAEYWRGWIEAKDVKNEIGSTFSPAGSPDVVSFSGIDVNSSIVYGVVLAGSDTGSSNTVTTLTNTGNRQINAEISGDNLCTDYPSCTGNIILSTNQQFSTTTFTYGSGTTLSVSPVTLNLNLQKPASSPSDSYSSVYWGIAIPETKEVGNYSGIVTVLAVPQ